MPKLFPPKKLVAFQLNKGTVGFVGGNQYRCPLLILPFQEEHSGNVSEDKKNLPTYGDTKSFCMRKAEIPHKYHKILCILQSSKMSNATNMDCFHKVSKRGFPSPVWLRLQGLWIKAVTTFWSACLIWKEFWKIKQLSYLKANTSHLFVRFSQCTQSVQGGMLPPMSIK